MADTLAFRAKEEGSKAWVEGNYSKALEGFSEAINHGGDKDFLKVIYSNRSAVYLKLNKPEDALKDGNKAIELDANWPKGYTRKGDALYQLKRFTDAYNAYNSGVRVAPNDAGLKEKVELAMKALRNEASRSSSSSSSSSSAPQSAPATGIVRQGKLAVVLLILLYFVPFLGSINTMAYRVSSGIYAIIYVFELYQKYGAPKFSTEYGMQIIPDPATMKVFLGGVNAMSFRPYMFAIAPLFFTELTCFTPEIFNYLRANSAAIEGKVLPMLARYVPNIAQIGLSGLLSPNNIPAINQQLHVMGATAEVYQGIFLAFELFLPTRSILQLYLWWQYLRMRVMLDRSNTLRRIFGEFDAKINQLLAHQMVPGLVRQGYGYLRNFMQKQAEMPSADQQQANGGSIFPKCSIM